MNIIDYLLWRGDISFKESAFCAIDALILTQLSYLNLSGLAPNSTDKVTLKDLANSFKGAADYKARCDLGAVINKKTVDLLFLAANSNRFSNVSIFLYEDRFNNTKTEQFCAMSFDISPLITFIAFRGTDDTITGWKEDFLLAIKDAVTAQNDAKDYLENVAGKTRGTILLGGHSKGGNLAIYAANNAQDKTKNRIKAIFNMDGPGFPKAIAQSNNFIKQSRKVYSYYPAGSVVGMLFFNAGSVTVVESDGMGLFQHDPFTWHILGKSFVTKSSLDKASIIFSNTFNEWIENCTTEQLTVFIDTLFTVVEASGAMTGSQLERLSPADALKLLSTATKIDKQTRKTLLTVLAALKDPLVKSLK